MKAADEAEEFSAGTAILLNEWLGQRKADILGLRRAIYQDGKLRITQEKTGVIVTLNVRIVPHLHARLEAELQRSKAKNPDSEFVLLTRTGLAWSENKFAALVKTLRDPLEKKYPGLSLCTFMTLRHTAVTRMFEAGLEIPAIAAISGHSLESCEAILDRYGIRTALLADRALQQRYEFELTKENSNVHFIDNSTGETPQKLNVRLDSELNKTQKPEERCVP